MIEIEYGDIEIVDDTIQEEVDNIIEFEDDLQFIEETYKPYDEFLKKYNYDPSSNTIVVNGRRANAGKIGSKKERNRINAFLRRHKFDPETGTIEIPTDDVHNPTTRVRLNPGVIIHPGGLSNDTAIGSTVDSAGDMINGVFRLKKQGPGSHYNPDGTMSVDQSYIDDDVNNINDLANNLLNQDYDMTLSKRVMQSKPMHSDRTTNHEAGHINQFHRNSLNYPTDSNDFYDTAQMMQGVSDQERRGIDESHYNPEELDADAFAFKHMDPNYTGAEFEGQMRNSEDQYIKKRRKADRKMREKIKNMSTEERAEYIKQKQQDLENQDKPRTVLNIVNELNEDSRALSIRAAQLDNWINDEPEAPKYLHEKSKQLKFIQLDPNNKSTYKAYYDQIYDYIKAFLDKMIVMKDKKNGKEKIFIPPLIFKITRNILNYIALLYLLITTCGIDTMLIRKPGDLEDRARQLQYAYMNYQKHTKTQETQANQRKLSISQLEQQIASGQLTPDQIDKAKKKIQSIRQYEAGLTTQQPQQTQNDQGWDGSSPLPQRKELSKTQKKKQKQQKRNEEYLALGKHVSDQMDEYRRRKEARQQALERSSSTPATHPTTDNTPI